MAVTIASSIFSDESILLLLLLLLKKEIMYAVRITYMYVVTQVQLQDGIASISVDYLTVWSFLLLLVVVVMAMFLCFHFLGVARLRRICFSRITMFWIPWIFSLSAPLTFFTCFNAYTVHTKYLLHNFLPIFILRMESPWILHYLNMHKSCATFPLHTILYSSNYFVSFAWVYFVRNTNLNVYATDYTANGSSTHCARVHVCVWEYVPIVAKFSYMNP